MSQRAVCNWLTSTQSKRFKMTFFTVNKHKNIYIVHLSTCPHVNRFVDVKYAQTDVDDVMNNNINKTNTKLRLWRFTL